jgi:5-methylcytosine-specific restriction protein A
MRERVKTLPDIIENFYQFKKIVENRRNKAFDRFTQFSHWYYFPKEKSFAPNKFLRYKGTTLENYKGEGYGNANDSNFLKYFSKVEKDSETFKQLYSELEEFAKGIQNILNDAIKIYILKDEFTYNEHNDEPEQYFKEGKAKQVFVNIYERNKEARRKCIEYYGYECFACGSILSDIYGEIAESFIHIHHIVELSSVREEYTMDPVIDLRPLCPNCHAIIHRTSPALSIEELKGLINSKNDRFK